MKRLGLIFAFLVCITTVDGFCGAARQDRFKPLNDALIGIIRNDYNQKLDNLGYYLSAPLTFTTNDEGKNGKIDMTGRFVLDQNKKTKELRITNSVKGKYVDYTPGSKETFVIMFSGRFRLAFESNAQTTGFDLASAKDLKNEYVYTENKTEDHTPHLRIYYRYNINDKNGLMPGPTLAGPLPPPPPPDPAQLTQALEAARTEAVQLTKALEASKDEAGLLTGELKTTRTEAGQLTLALETARKESTLLATELSAAKDETIKLRKEIEKTNVPGTETGGTETGGTGTGTDTPDPDLKPSRDILGNGTLKTDNAVNYIISRNPAAARRDVEALIDAYIREAQRENINYDIAVAQMCYATSHLSDKQLVNINNYAGFDAINGVPVRYSNMNEGVRAHIQHLKGYASRDKPQGNIVDKRYNILGNILGTVKNLDALFRVWAPRNYQHYGDSIDSILKGLYSISG